MKPDGFETRLPKPAPRPGNFKTRLGRPEMRLGNYKTRTDRPEARTGNFEIRTDSPASSLCRVLSRNSNVPVKGTQYAPRPEFPECGTAGCAANLWRAAYGKAAFGHKKGGGNRARR
ncbi:hypothetical protein [Treponema endosymbiont of Eucomonympha sp.]|uniref:hypothetical protein n=1 Tax=Treponema endosymbiont of Eucomonympha sp. TaxID=1580831 RepID=UPI0007854AD6|nr:hypothetical protein [Treponema endosymbiont of Eucomonympha sp.]